MSLGILIMLSYLFGTLGVPPLSGNDMIRLSPTIDGVDSLGEGFAVLVEDVSSWSPPVERAKSIPLRLILSNPASFRGEFLTIEGVLLQREPLGSPWVGVEEWSMRDRQGGLLLLYVVGAREISIGSRVKAQARFYKTMTIEGRDMQMRVYPTFVTHVIAIDQVSVSPMTYWPFLLIMLIIGFVAVFILGRLGRSKIRLAPRVKIRSEDVLHATNESCGTLSEDPAQALSDLYDQSEDPT